MRGLGRRDCRTRWACETTTRTLGIACQSRLPRFGLLDDRGQLVLAKQLVDILGRREDTHTLALDQFGMAHTNARPECLLLSKSPPPDRPCSGIRSVTRNGRSVPVSLSSNQRTSTS